MAWNSKWIWHGGEKSPRNSYTYMRRTFTLDSRAQEALVKVSADSRYKLWVNGRFVGRGPVRSDPRWQRYDRYDITPYLLPGENVVTALVHHYGEMTFFYQLGRGAFLLDCTIRTESGSYDISTDSRWKVKPSDAWYTDIPRMDIQLGFQEIFDSSKYLEGWIEPGYDDSGWENAIEIGPVGIEPWTGMSEREIPELVEEFIYPVKLLEKGQWDATKVDLGDDPVNYSKLMWEEDRKALRIDFDESKFPHPNIEDLMTSSVFIPEASALSDKAGGRENKFIVKYRSEWSGSEKGMYYVIDFGREVMGFPVIRVTAESGCVIDIGYSELLEDGKVNPYRGEIRFSDRIIAKPGTTDFEMFDKRAFRYMQIDVREMKGDVTIELVGLKFSTYPVKWRGSFECSDQRLNKIWQLGAYTDQLCMEDGFTDCPWRERAQWWGDARIEAFIAYYAFGDTALVKKGLKDIAHSQRPDGITACFAPGDPDYVVPIPSFTLIWVLSVWDYYCWTGDKELIEEIYPNVVKAIGWFQSYLADDSLVTNVSYWNFIDWEEVDIRGKTTWLNAFFVGALDGTAGMAEVLGKAEEAKQWRDLAERVKNAINSNLYIPEKGVYSDCWCDGELSQVVSQQTNSLAILFDVAPSERWDTIIEHIYNPENKVVPAGSPYFSFYLLQALFHAGKHELGLKYIRDKWSVMLDWGATSCWEVWHTESSLCHGWSGGPTYYLPSQVLGVRAKEPGFGTFTVRPNPVDLTWARGTIPTVKGDIKVEWHVNEGFDLGVHVPEGTKAEVILPFDGTVEINGVQDGASLERDINGLSIVRLDAGIHKLRLLQ